MSKDRLSFLAQIKIARFHTPHNHENFENIFVRFVFMTPDYPHKIFNDKRYNYNLLMEVLALDGLLQA